MKRIGMWEKNRRAMEVINMAQVHYVCIVQLIYANKILKLKKNKGIVMMIW
jgi:hypothetical protein